jgi:CRP/FNR family cyclic AMP-dependent transcriptional regulator
MMRGSESLAGIPLFASLDPADLRTLDSRCRWRIVRAGEWANDYPLHGTDIFFILKGRARVVIGPPGHELILADYREGEFFGQLAALDGHSRSTGVRAISDTVVARMPAAVFYETMHRYPSVCDKVIARLVDTIRSLTARANEQAHLDVRERLCAELLRLSRRTFDGRVVVSPPPTHAELAGRIGTHREAVTKLLNALDREGVISRARGAIVLTRPEFLCRIVTEADAA